MRVQKFGGFRISHRVGGDMKITIMQFEYKLNISNNLRHVKCLKYMNYSKLNCKNQVEMDVNEEP